MNIETLTGRTLQRAYLYTQIVVGFQPSSSATGSLSAKYKAKLSLNEVFNLYAVFAIQKNGFEYQIFGFTSF